MSKLRQSAKGQECTARIPGVCNFRPETTVLAHINGAGIGRKDNDLFGSFCCSDCHFYLDGGYVKNKVESTREQRDLWHLQAVIRTQRAWLAMGLVRAE